jgi:hypothetical protein
MSETKTAAVLLWLFELGRKGPRFTTAMNALWFCIAIFLCLLIHAAALVVLKFIIWYSEILDQPQWLLHAPLIMLFVGALIGTVVAGLWRAFRLAGWLLLFTVVIVGAEFFLQSFPGWFSWHEKMSTALWWANVALVPLLAFITARVAMGNWGLLAAVMAYALSWGFLAIYLGMIGIGLLKEQDTFQMLVADGRLPWSLVSLASRISAWVLVGTYLAINALFLVPFLGDAARYFRNSPANVAVRRETRKVAVDTIDMLHRLRIYDRIIVVAHSLGTVVAYDMLRAYYSRICDQIVFDPNALAPEFKQVNDGNLTADELRSKGREIIRKMAKNIGPRDRLIPSGTPPEAWLVTDFVTLGSPLTHARYLMCNGETSEELGSDFRRRLEEREFPTCPPTTASGDPDGWLAFENPLTKELKLHHGGLFALTRWTNLYFPVSQLFWGDPVGGPVGTEDDGKRPLFGPYIKDQKVKLSSQDKANFFTHTAYWSLKRGNGYDAPHIAALRAAVNLADKS